MGSGTFSRVAYSTYASESRLLSKSVSENFVSNVVDVNNSFIPKNFNGIRESRDSSEHPTSNPIIIGLDVTGSMSGVLDTVVKNVNTLITTIYEENLVPHPQIMFIGFGDIEMDRVPAQVTQFESDIRLLTQLQEIYFERGGGGNGYESYTLPWHIANIFTSIDSLEKRGIKGTLFTIGDEPLNPILTKDDLNRHGISTQEDIHTQQLFDDVSKKYNIYHINVKERVSSSLWNSVLGERFIQSDSTNVHNTIINILRSNAPAMSSIAEMANIR